MSGGEREYLILDLVRGKERLGVKAPAETRNTTLTVVESLGTDSRHVRIPVRGPEDFCLLNIPRILLKHGRTHAYTTLGEMAQWLRVVAEGPFAPELVVQ